MSQYNQDLYTRLASIEKDLRALAAIAAREGHWPVVRAASLAAENLIDIPTSTKQTKTYSNQRTRQNTHQETDKTKKSRHIAGTIYPRFEHVDGDLVKIGWSRSAKSEYRHRAPETAIGQVATAIKRLAQKTGVFTADDLFPIIDPNDGSDVPTYQGYLVLRWFRELGLVEPNGRSEYIVPDATGLPKAAQKHWMDLCNKEKH